MEVSYEQISDVANNRINPYNCLTHIDYDCQSLDYYIKEIKLLFEIDKLYECFNLVKKTEAMINLENIIYINDKKEIKEDLLLLFKKNPIVAAIYEDMKLAEKCNQLLSMMQTVKAERDSKGIKTWFKFEEEIKSITICGSTIIKGDLVHILSVLAEMDLYKEFISQFEDLKLLQSITSFRLIVHAKLKMPVMVTNRDLILEGFGLMDTENKTILMPVRGIKTKKHFDCEIPAESSSYKRIDLHFGFFHIKCLDKDTYEISNAYNVDPKVPVIPWFLLNSVIKEINYYVLDGIRKQVSSEKSKKLYDKRINERYDFYERIKIEMNEINK